MIVNLSHQIIRKWLDKNIDTFVHSISHRENLEQVPVLTPTGKIKVKSIVFDMKISVTVDNEEICHEILDWLHEQEFEGQWVAFTENNRFITVAFAHKKDAAQFKMCWMDNIRYEYIK